jgi:hypothetical protein
MPDFGEIARMLQMIHGIDRRRARENAQQANEEEDAPEEAVGGATSVFLQGYHDVVEPRIERESSPQEYLRSCIDDTRAEYKAFLENTSPKA